MYMCFFFIFFNETVTTESYTYVHTLSLHDALPICPEGIGVAEVHERAEAAAAFRLGEGVGREGARVVDVLVLRDHVVVAAEHHRPFARPPPPRVVVEAVHPIGRASCRERVCQYV